MAIRRKKKPNLVLPLSSMGDIAFLLIIFFMLASNFMKTGNVDLEKPAAPGLEKQEAAKCSVMMDKDAVIWYEGTQVDVREVPDRLREVVESDHGFAVHVTIHKTLARKDFMPLIEAVSESGAQLILTGEPED